MEYLFIVVFALILGRFYSLKPTNKLVVGYWLLCVYCIALFGLRYRVGMDTLNYMDSYYEVIPLNKLKIEDLFGLKVAPLYGLIQSFCKMLSSQFYVMQLAVAALFNIPLFWFVKNHTNNPYYGFCLFFIIEGLYFNTDIMRESLAVVCFLINLDNIEKKRWTRYYFGCLIAVSLHYSALITLLFPFARKMRFNMLYIVLLILFFFAQKMIGDYLLPFITYEAIANRVASLQKFGESLNINWIIMRVLRHTVVPIFIIAFARFYRKHHRYEWCSCLYALIGLGCIEYSIIFSRFTNYLVVPFLIYLLETVFSSRKYVIKYLIIFLFLFISFYSRIKSKDFKLYIPYHSIYNPQTESEREWMRDERFN